MNLFASLFRSTLGKKYLMAVSGLALLLFVVGHMLGNLQIFLGQEALNAYGAFLKSKAALLWSARIGLIGLVLIHLWSAITLNAKNNDARPVRYRVNRAVGATYASRTMVWSGIIVLAFIIYHLLHFTLGVTDPSFLELKDEAGRHDIYAMVVQGFNHPLVSAFYIIAMALLCLHLSHGASSLFQSLGFRSGPQKRWADRLALLLAWGIFAGNSSIPIAILLGFGKEALKQ